MNTEIRRPDNLVQRRHDCRQVILVFKSVNTIKSRLERRNTGFVDRIFIHAGRVSLPTCFSTGVGAWAAAEASSVLWTAATFQIARS